MGPFDSRGELRNGRIFSISTSGARRNVAVLRRNGLSIAFDLGLNSQALTVEMMRRIERSDGGDVVAALKVPAEALSRGVTSASDCALFVGAFSAESRTMGSLLLLASPDGHRRS